MSFLDLGRFYSNACLVALIAGPLTEDVANPFPFLLLYMAAMPWCLIDFLSELLV